MSGLVVTGAFKNMLKLSEIQFRQISVSYMAARLVDTLRASYPMEAGVTRQEDLSRICGQLTAAQNFGFSSEKDQAMYVLYAWLMGDNFMERYNVVREHLLDETIPRNMRWDWLGEWFQEGMSRLKASIPNRGLRQ